MTGFDEMIHRNIEKHKDDYAKNSNMVVEPRDATPPKGNLLQRAWWFVFGYKV